MNDNDAFFTQTIVGAPFSVPLGQRLTRHQLGENGLVIDFETGENRLTQAWRDWWMLSHAEDAAGRPRVRPGRVRRWLERHALWVAMLGLACLLVSGFIWSVVLWK
jgi:hypothetical protein